MHMTMATGTSGHTFGVRVQRVHKVQRVQRVVVAPFGRRFEKNIFKTPCNFRIYLL